MIDPNAIATGGDLRWLKDGNANGVERGVGRGGGIMWMPGETAGCRGRSIAGVMD